MYIFWDSMLKFPRFFVSVLIGFFLTILSPFFELFKDPMQQIKMIAIIFLALTILLQTLRFMLALS